MVWIPEAQWGVGGVAVKVVFPGRPRPPTLPAGGGRGGGESGLSGEATPPRLSPLGVGTDEGVGGPEFVEETDWGGVYIGRFSITHSGLLRANRVLNAATCDADLVPTNLANSLLDFHPILLTASLNRSTSASVHLFPPFFVVTSCVSVTFALGCRVAASWANVAETAAWWNRRLWFLRPLRDGRVLPQ